MRLYAHKECWDFMEQHPAEFHSFGCGPGGLGDFFVPDTMYGLDISLACKIHDWYYRFYDGNSEADRKMADMIFRDNLLIIIRANSKSRVLRWLRERRCEKYYHLVRSFGGPAFYEEREPVDEFNGLILREV